MPKDILRRLRIFQQGQADRRQLLPTEMTKDRRNRMRRRPTTAEILHQTPLFETGIIKGGGNNLRFPSRQQFHQERRRRPSRQSDAIAERHPRQTLHNRPLRCQLLVGSRSGMETDAEEIKEMEVGQKRLQHRRRALGMGRQSELETIRCRCQFVLMQGFEEIFAKIAAPQQGEKMLFGQMTIFQQGTENLGSAILDQGKELIAFGQQGPLQALHQFGGEETLLRLDSAISDPTP